MHIYEREFLGDNAFEFPSGSVKKLFPIGFPPAGRLLHVNVRQVQSEITAGDTVAFIARVYDRDYSTTVAATRWVSVGDPVTDGTFTVPALSCPAAPFFGEIHWTLSYVPHSMIGVEFEGLAGTSLAIHALGTGDALPVDANTYDQNSMHIYYLPAGAAYGPGKPMIVVDENIANGSNTEGDLSASAGGIAWYSSGLGRPYQNREGTFTVPVRKLYLEIELGSAASQDYHFEVEIGCEIGNELN